MKELEQQEAVMDYEGFQMFKARYENRPLDAARHQRLYDEAQRKWQALKDWTEVTA